MLIARLSVKPREEVEGAQLGNPHSDTSGHVAETQRIRRTLQIDVEFVGLATLAGRLLPTRFLPSARRALRTHSEIYLALFLLLCFGLVHAAHALGQFESTDFYKLLFDMCSAAKEGGPPRVTILWLLPIFVAWLLPRRHALCVIHLIVLRPHEPLPLIKQRIVNASNHHVLAIRSLGEDAFRSLFGMLTPGRADEVNVSATDDLTSSRRATLVHRVPWEDYWALVRYCVALMLPAVDGDREFGRAAYFTYKQHRYVLKWYIAMLGLALTLPMCSLWPTGYEPHLKQLLGLLGATWAIFAILSHRRSMRRMQAWEAQMRIYPFRGCPIRRCVGTPEGQVWDEVHSWQFERPIRTFGMNYAQMHQIILTVLLGILLTTLQLM